MKIERGSFSVTTFAAHLSAVTPHCAAAALFCSGLFSSSRSGELWDSLLLATLTEICLVLWVVGVEEDWKRMKGRSTSVVFCSDTGFG